MTSLCIYGRGPVGLTALKLAKPMRPKQIICVDPNPARRKMGMENGADTVLDSDGKTVSEIIRLTGGGAERSIDTSGSPSAQRNIIESAGHFGRIAEVGYLGLYEKEGGVSLSQLNQREIEVFGSSVISLPQTHELIEFMVENDVHFDSLVTHRFPLEKAKEAFELFNTLNTGKVVFEFD
jgi:threonine dehydrogenase-like Zn-dependent dehydrogenase